MLAKNNIEQLNDYVINYVEDFFIDLESRGSKHTESQYRGNINEFIKSRFGYELDFLTKKDLNLIDVDYVISYFNNMYKATDKKGNKIYMNSTINSKLSSVKSFLKYMKFRKVIDLDINDLVYIKNFKKDSVSHETVPMDIVINMIKDIRKNEGRFTKEKEWFIKIAVETGLRADDILRLTRQQFKVLPNRMEVLITSIGSNKGKGNKDWKEVISVDLYNELKEDLFKGERDNLFTMSKSTFNKMMPRVLDRLGIEKNYTPHGFKRTAVNNTRTLTGDLKAAQIKGKHSSSVTTDIYLDEVEYGATGYFSMMNKTDENLINEVSHSELLEALNGLDDSTKLLINIKLQEIINNKQK